MPFYFVLRAGFRLKFYLSWTPLDDRSELVRGWVVYFFVVRASRLKVFGGSLRIVIPSVAALMLYQISNMCRPYSLVRLQPISVFGLAREPPFKLVFEELAGTYRMLFRGLGWEPEISSEAEFLS